MIIILPCKCDYVLSNHKGWMRVYYVRDCREIYQSYFHDGVYTQ